MWPPRVMRLTWQLETLMTHCLCCVENTVEGRIMDSGASFHATYCKEELERFKLRSGKVRLACDKNLGIAGVGDAVLKTSFGTSWTMKDVRYIPGLKRRLISVGQLDEEGYHVGFGDRQCKVTNGNLVVAHRNKRGNLYMVEDWWFGKAQESFLYNVSEDKETAETAAGVTNGIVMLKVVLETPLQFGVTERFRAERMGLRAEAPKMLWADSVNSSSLTKPIQKSQVVLVDILENLAEKYSIVAEHRLSLKITQSPGRNSNTSEGSKNSGSFEDSGRLDEEDSEYRAFFEEGGSETPQRMDPREEKDDVHQIIAEKLNLDRLGCKNVEGSDRKSSDEVPQSSDQMEVVEDATGGVGGPRGVHEHNVRVRSDPNIASGNNLRPRGPLAQSGSDTHTYQRGTGFFMPHDGQNTGKMEFKPWTALVTEICCGQSTSWNQSVYIRGSNVFGQGQGWVMLETGISVTISGSSNGMEHNMRVRSDPNMVRANMFRQGTPQVSQQIGFFGTPINPFFPTFASQNAGLPVAWPPVQSGTGDTTNEPADRLFWYSDESIFPNFAYKMKAYLGASILSMGMSSNADMAVEARDREEVVSDQGSTSEDS
ncbi:hypothetical protein Tco_0629807 [Tanacetum coccineum]|uniref:Retrovirus-related Pol polyprotein from transposon TNT 1-94-like beta-barrel domain-containing protein n=1 Tax=Tanacetum coccineum TaxID=301880 RepID=A0ABQ4WUG2_9ASTR